MDCAVATKAARWKHAFSMKPEVFPLAGPGSVQQFQTTHWSVVVSAGKARSSQSAEALEKLCRIYWPPLYSFIRRQGHGEADAQDLTQEFFARLLARNDFETVDPRKGKFRTFLLAALTHFLANERDRAGAAKRGGGQRIISLDEMRAEQTGGWEPSSDLSPDKLFDARWAMTVLEQALARLAEEMTAGGKQGQFEQLKGFLTEEPGEGEYAAIAGGWGTTSQTVAVMVHRLRRRYQELVRTEVAHTVESPLEVEAEMRLLLEALS
jgi:RNA polymerase sigma factor (sigma-70 family)